MEIVAKIINHWDIITLFITNIVALFIPPEKLKIKR